MRGSYISIGGSQKENFSILESFFFTILLLIPLLPDFHKLIDSVNSFKSYIILYSTVEFFFKNIDYSY